MSSPETSQLVPAEPTQLRGHCACGRARFTISVSPGAPECILRNACHCSTCSRINGAPFIWTSHWKYDAVKWDGADGRAPPDFGPALQTWESMPGRKFKLRCTHCGSPLGTWSKAYNTFSIWPTTLARGPPTDENPQGKLIGIEIVSPRAHQFYGPWRTCNIDDDLPKYVGYPGKSQRVDNQGNPIDDV